MRICYVSTLVLLLALAACSGAFATNLITNGDFEAWSATVAGDNWTYYYGGGSNVDRLSYGSQASTWAGSVHPDPHVYAGNDSQHIAVIYDGKTYSHAGVSQTINVTPGQRYKISAYIAACTTGWVPDVTNIHVGYLGVDNGALWRPDFTKFVAAGGNAYFTDWVQTDYKWVQRSIEFIPTGDQMTIFLDGYHNTGQNNSTRNIHVFFDDVVVEAIPEPSGLIALLGGLPIIGFAIRRRK